MRLDYVAWTMFDGATMAGTIVSHWGNSLTVKRVDGGIVTIDRSKTRTASADDVLSACSWFNTLGK